ncbi:MAG: hypothetical protein R3C19_07715 [Planctomycetaceae bacterium]
MQKFDFNGTHLATIPVIANPGGITADEDGLLYISHFPAGGSDSVKSGDCISVYDSTGKLLRKFGRSGSGDGELSWPGGVAIGPDGHVYVADQTNRRVQVFDKDGRFLAKFGEYGTEPGQFGGTTNPQSRVGGPQFLTFDHDGNLYTTEGMVCRVQKLTKAGVPLLQWGTNKDAPGHFGGTFTGSYLEGPVGITVDADDHIWVASLSGRIQQFDADGKYLGGIQTGQGAEAGKFSAPHGIAINPQGELFVVDSYNHRIQKFATK